MKLEAHRGDKLLFCGTTDLQIVGAKDDEGDAGSFLFSLPPTDAWDGLLGREHDDDTPVRGGNSV